MREGRPDHEFRWNNWLEERNLENVNQLCILFFVPSSLIWCLDVKEKAVCVCLSTPLLFQSVSIFSLCLLLTSSFPSSSSSPFQVLSWTSWIVCFTRLYLFAFSYTHSHPHHKVSASHLWVPWKDEQWVRGDPLILSSNHIRGTREGESEEIEGREESFHQRITLRIQPLNKLNNHKSEMHDHIIIAYTHPHTHTHIEWEGEKEREKDPAFSLPFIFVRRHSISAHHRSRKRCAERMKDASEEH